MSERIILVNVGTANGAVVSGLLATAEDISMPELRYFHDLKSMVIVCPRCMVSSKEKTDWLIHYENCTSSVLLLLTEEAYAKIGEKIRLITGDNW